MRQIRRSALVAASPQRMFDLINDVESYPQFVPGCVAAEVLERDADSLRARLTVGNGLMRTSFVTRNRLQSPHAIDMELDEGPLRSLSGKWRLTPVIAGDMTGCRVDMDLTFEVHPGLAGLVLGPALERVAASLVDAFVARARAPG